MRDKQLMGRDKALSHLMGVPAGSGGSGGVPAHLADAGGTEQTQGIWGYWGGRLAAEPAGVPQYPATKLIANGLVRAGGSCGYTALPP